MCFTCIVFSFFKTAETASILDIKENDFVIGDNNAPITIVEYASLSCIHCANFHHDTLPKLMEEYIKNGKIKIIFRDYPLNYPALIGSMALQCVDRDIRYDYLNALFLLQPKWVSSDLEIVKKEIFKIMQTGGMTKERFNKCLEDKDLEKNILQGIMDVQKEFDITTTPSFLINGNILKGNKSFNNFKKIINELLTKSE